MNTKKATKPKARTPKLFERKIRTVKKIKKGKILRNLKVKKLTKISRQTDFFDTQCEFKGILESMIELASRFEIASRRAIIIEGTAVSKGQTKNIDEFEKVLELKAVSIVEQMRSEMNTKGLKICIHCYLHSSEFLRRIFRKIIFLTFINSQRIKGMNFDSKKVKRSYFTLVANQIQSEIDNFEQNVARLARQYHKNKEILLRPFLFEGPKELVYPNVYERRDDYCPQTANTHSTNSYIFLREGQSQLDYMKNLQLHLARQDSRIQRIVDAIQRPGEQTNSQEEDIEDQVV